VTRIEHALSEIADARERLDELTARHPQPPGPEVAAAADSVTKLLDRAERAAAADGLPVRRWLARRWSGDQLEAAYHPLHAAKVHLVELYDDEEIDAAIPAAVERATRYLDRGDQRRVAAERLATLPARERRAGLRAAREAGYEASDGDFHQQRVFRNALIVATALTVLLVLVLAGVLFLRPEFAPLCFESVRQEGAMTMDAAPSQPGNGEPVTTTRQTVCPSGTGIGRAPDGWDVVLVLLFGVVGATLAAAVTVRSLKVTTSPYDVPLVLSILKLPLGALTAVVGVMAIQGGLVPGLSALDSPAEVLTYAVVLGYAQQLATGFLDRRASTLGKSDPS
jgi:hypothetical protein